MTWAQMERPMGFVVESLAQLTAENGVLRESMREFLLAPPAPHQRAGADLGGDGGPVDQPQRPSAGTALRTPLAGGPRREELGRNGGRGARACGGGRGSGGGRGRFRGRAAPEGAPRSRKPMAGRAASTPRRGPVLAAGADGAAHDAQTLLGPFPGALRAALEHAVQAIGIGHPIGIEAARLGQRALDRLP